MDRSAREIKTEKLFSVPVVLALLCFFVIFGIINFIGFEKLSSSDVYADTLIAKMMWEQKTLFPDGYIFGNQFYVVATPVLAALLYGLIGSINTAMALATTVMSLFIMVALAWMLKPFIKSELSLWCALLAMVACAFAPKAVVQDECQLFFILASYYACYLICCFVCFGDYVRAGVDASLRPWALGLSLFLCFCTGMQSLRQTCVTVLPLLAFEILQALRRKLKNGEFWPADQRRQLYRCLGYLAANLLGLVFIKLLDKPQYTIYYGQSLFGGASLGDKLQLAFDACYNISGAKWFNHGYPLCFSLLFVFFGLVLFIAAFIVLFRRDRVHKELASFWWLTVISLIAVLSASVVSSVNMRSIYLFTYYPLLVFSFVIILDAFRGRLRLALAALLCVLSLGNAFFSYHDNVEFSLDNAVTPAEQICRIAMEQGCEYVYGSPAAAPYIAVHSDGALISGNWETDCIFKVIPFLNIQNIYHWEDYSKAIFVFMPWEAEVREAEIAGNGAKLTLLGQFGDFTVYTSSQQLLYPLTRD